MPTHRGSAPLKPPATSKSEHSGIRDLPHGAGSDAPSASAAELREARKAMARIEKQLARLADREARLPGDMTLLLSHATLQYFLAWAGYGVGYQGDIRLAETPEPEHVDQPPLELDPSLDRALRSLSRLDREALLLVAWEDLTSKQAARALGINATAFRVRLLRARRRLRASLEQAEATAPVASHLAHADVEGT